MFKTLRKNLKLTHKKTASTNKNLLNKIKLKKQKNIKKLKNNFLYLKKLTEKNYTQEEFIFICEHFKFESSKIYIKDLAKAQIYLEDTIKDQFQKIENEAFLSATTKAIVDTDYILTYSSFLLNTAVRARNNNISRYKEFFFEYLEYLSKTTSKPIGKEYKKDCCLNIYEYLFGNGFYNPNKAKSLNIHLEKMYNFILNLELENLRCLTTKNLFKIIKNNFLIGKALMEEYREKANELSTAKQCKIKSYVDKDMSKCFFLSKSSRSRLEELCFLSTNINILLKELTKITDKIHKKIKKADTPMDFCTYLLQVQNNPQNRGNLYDLSIQNNLKKQEKQSGKAEKNTQEKLYTDNKLLMITTMAKNIAIVKIKYLQEIIEDYTQKLNFKDDPLYEFSGNTIKFKISQRKNLDFTQERKQINLLLKHLNKVLKENNLNTVNKNLIRSFALKNK